MSRLRLKPHWGFCFASQPSDRSIGTVKAFCCCCFSIEHCWFRLNTHRRLSQLSTLSLNRPSPSGYHNGGNSDPRNAIPRSYFDSLMETMP